VRVLGLCVKVGWLLGLRDLLNITLVKESLYCLDSYCSYPVRFGSQELASRLFGNCDYQWVIMIVVRSSYYISHWFTFSTTKCKIWLAAMYFPPQ